MIDEMTFQRLIKVKRHRKERDIDRQTEACKEWQWNPRKDAEKKVQRLMKKNQRKKARNEARQKKKRKKKKD